MSLTNKRNLDRFKGCLIGGAIGDALGYPVEFYSLDEIYSEYGGNGIRDYKLINGKALISDDTQMTLFTANGLLFSKANKKISGINGSYTAAIWGAYQDWLRTQCDKDIIPGSYCSWLINIPDLHVRRAPGNTCISALMENEGGTLVNPINDSKGCGGIMRVAPIALFFAGNDYGAYKADMIGAEAAALTHGHDLGYIPAAALIHIIYSIASGEVTLLEYAVKYSLTAVKKLFPDAPHLTEFIELINLAVELSSSNLPDAEAIRQLGEGWVAEETLAIAVYCALKYQNNFEKAIIASVNHNGDSDSTGAVTGNIMGALLGFKNIPEKFIANLEMESLIEEIAEDLHTDYSDSEEWRSKYVDCNFIFNAESRKKEEVKPTAIEDLMAFIPVLQTDKFGELIIDKKNDGSLEHPIQFPWVAYTPAVKEFMQTVYKFVEDNKDYDLYNYREIIKRNGINHFSDAEIENLNVQCVLAIIVFCVRQERFCDGMLLKNLQNGVILKCLGRLTVCE